MGRPTINKETFWNFVAIDDGCWMWLGRVNATRPYGRVTVNGRNRLAHRLSWEYTNGPVRPGLEVCHSCDNPRCVRPGHLFLATHAGNMADMARKGRSTAMRGENAVHAKLTADEATVIRTSRESARLLAVRYGVHKSQINKIRRGSSWKHLP